MSFKDDVRINPTDLPSEWLKHPVIYLEYAGQLLDAQLKRDKLKDDLEQLHAEIDADVRARATAQGTKLTETAIKKQVTADEDYIALKQSLTEVDHEVDVLQYGLRALDQKRVSLEYLSKYELSGWHSEPKIPEEHRGEREKEQRRQTPQKLGLKGKRK